FGDVVNERSHQPLVDADTWARVQRMRLPRGPKSKSERLLARVGVLRCGTCGSRMVVGTANHGRYHLYRCPPVGDCARRVTVGADIVERAVAERVQELLEGMRGTASAASGVEDAARELEAAQAALEAAIRAFSGLDDEAAARERLA